MPGNSARTLAISHSSTERLMFLPAALPRAWPTGGGERNDTSGIDCNLCPSWQPMNCGDADQRDKSTDRAVVSPKLSLNADQPDAAGLQERR